MAKAHRPRSFVVNTKRTHISKDALENGKTKTGYRFCFLESGLRDRLTHDVVAGSMNSEEKRFA